MNQNQLWMLGSTYVVRASTVLITCMLIISNVFVLSCHQKEISIKFLVKACDGSQLVLVPSSLREVTEKKICYCYFIKSSFTIGSHVDGKESRG